MKMVSVAVTIIVTLALSRCQGFILQLTPEFIDTQITKRVTLTCLPGDRTSIDGAITSMRILKEGETHHWKVLSEIEKNKTHITSYEKNMFASGHIGSLNDSDLNITWPSVTTNIFGRYRCDVQGFKRNGDFIWENSQEVIISDSNATVQNVLFLIKEEKENNEDELRSVSKRIESINQLLQSTAHKINDESNDHKENIEKLEKRMTNVTDIIARTSEELAMRDDNIEEKLANVRNIIKENLTERNQERVLTEAVTKNLTQSFVQMSAVVESLVTKVQSIMGTGTKQFWPQGHYGLLSTTEGCPVHDSSIWVSGYRRHNTESIDANHDQISSNNHFLQPVRERNINQNFVYQHFCLTNNSNSNYFWPMGSYCINKYSKECPYGFNSGFIYWDEEDTNSSSSVNGSLPQGEYAGTFTRIYYCCRSDGSASVPVYLPKDKPFYLYRYKGECQQVYGMSVSEEFILFDTENTNNRDKYESEVHPDGQAHKNVQLKLCYYSPIINTGNHGHNLQQVPR